MKTSVLFGFIGSLVLWLSSTTVPLWASQQQASTHTDSLLTHIAEVRQLSVEEASQSYRVRLEGVVTFTKRATSASPHTFFLQNGDDAIFVVFLGPITEIEPGDWIELTGTTDPGDFARIVFGQTLRRLRKAPLPSIVTRSMAQLRTGQEDSKWVEVEGVIRALRPTEDGFCELVIAHEGYRFRGILADTPQGAEPLHLLDTTVRIRGVAGATINQQRQLVGFKVFIPGEGFITPLVTSDIAPQILPIQASTSLLRFQEAPAHQRARLQGTVTLLLPDQQLFLQDAAGGVLVRMRDSTTALTVGHAIDVIGYPSAGAITPTLDDATYTPLQGAVRIMPRSLSPTEALAAENDGRLAALDVTLLDAEPQGNDITLTVQGEHFIFKAVLANRLGAETLADLQQGSRIRLTGVVQLLADPLQSLTDLSFNQETRNQSASSFRVLLRSAADVEVLSKPPWLTVPRALGIVSGLFGLVLVAIGWVVVLRKRVSSQTHTIRTQLKEMRVLKERAETAHRMQGRIFTNLSHEFRTPLTLILGPLRQVLRDLRALPKGRMRSQLETAFQNSQQLRHLIDQILDLTKAEAGHMIPQTETVDLIPLLKELVLGFGSLAETRRLTLHLEPTHASFPVSVDRDHIQKVCVNLLSNAIKFTDEEGQINIRISIDGEEAVVAIEDTGKGIDEAALPHIFDRYYQVDGSASRMQEGSGIGLALVKELLTLNGGRITVSSTVGIGTTFSIYLPLAPKATDVPLQQKVEVLRPLQATEVVSLSPKTSNEDEACVLIVEDNTALRSFLGSILEPHFHIVEAENGEVALSLIRQNLPDVILSDVMMPRMDGFALARHLRTDPAIAFIPLILLTARATTDDELWGLETGADDYIRKPFDPDVVVARVQNQIRLRHRLREHYTHELKAASPVSLDARSLLDRVQHVAANHLNDPAFGVDLLAKEVGLSASQLRRRLRQEADESPAALLRRMRLERAAVLLQQHQGNISEVAYGVGFNSLAHFSRCFREQFGVPPSAYT